MPGVLYLVHSEAKKNSLLKQTVGSDCAQLNASLWRPNRSDVNFWVGLVVGGEWGYEEQS